MPGESIVKRRGEQSEMKFVKRLLLVLVIGFALFYLVTQPEGAAEAVRTVVGAVAMAFQSIVTFFTTLAG